MTWYFPLSSFFSHTVASWAPFQPYSYLKEHSFRLSHQLRYSFFFIISSILDLSESSHYFSDCLIQFTNRIAMFARTFQRRWERLKTNFLLLKLERKMCIEIEFESFNQFCNYFLHLNSLKSSFDDNHIRDRNGSIGLEFKMH